MRETKISKICSERLGEHYFEIKHKSGLTAFVFPKDFSTCFGVIGVRFGAIDRKFADKKGKICELPAGTAHFLEHKMFENPDKTNSDEKFAALGADDNAYTTYGTTRYLFSATDNEYECLTELISMVRDPYFTRKNVKKEQGIINREIVMYDDNPYSVGMENLLSGLYKESFLRDKISGTLASVAEISDKTLTRAYENFYTTENMALSVCGRVTPEGVIEVLDRELSGLEPRAAAKSIMANEPMEISENYVEKRMKISRPMFFFGIKDCIDALDVSERTKRKCAMSLILNVLFSSSSEFYNRLLEEKLISPSFSFGYTMTRDQAYVMLSGESDEPERVVSLIKEKLESSAEAGLSAADFERARRVFAAGYIRLFDSSEEIADDVVLNSWFSGIEPFSSLDVLESLTLEYANGLLLKLRDKNQCLSVIKPLL